MITPNLPSGAVTFVFGDIEGSTSLLKRLGDEAYAEHGRSIGRCQTRTALGSEPDAMAKLG